MPDNVDKLFEIMQANGAANDRNKFRKVFLTPGNKGYKIRKDIYDGLRADGIIDSPTYEDFRRKLRLGGTPTVNKYRQQMFNSVDPNKSRASELTHRAVSQAKRAMNNVRKPVTAKVVDKKGKPTGEEFAITPAKTIEDLDREYAQETTKNWENELHAQMADADKDAAKISDMFKSFIGSTDEVGSVWGNMARGGGIAGTPHSVTTNNGILENTKARQLLAARDYNRKRKELLQLEQDSRNGAIFDNHSFFRGMYDAAKDTGFLTGGASDLINAGSLLATKQDLDNGIHTEAGDMLMQQAVKNSDAQSQYGDNKGWMYTGGVITTNMAPFMVQIGSAGFSKGMSNAIGKVVQGAASKVALGTMEKATGMAGAHIANYIGKVTGLTTKAFGKAIQYGIVGAAQANTVGLGNVANDVINRYTGQVYQDEQGNYKFGTFDSDGKLVHEGGEDFLTAFVKGEAAQTIEFATELAGGGIDAVGTALKNFVIKGGKKIINKYNMENVSKVIDFLLNNKVAKNARYLKAGADRTLGKVELNSIVGESLEEELGIIANTVFTGDNKISDLWDEKQQSQIWGGMLLSIGLMKGAVAPFHAYNAKQYYSYKHKLNKADVNLSQLLGKEKWEELRNQIDATTNEDMPEMVNRINRDVALGKNRQPVREYIQNLLIMRGYDIGNMLAAKKAVEDKGEGVSVKNMEKNQAYQQGRDAYGYDTHEIQLDQEDKQKSLAQLLGISEQQLASMSDEELEELSGRDDNIDRAIYDYQLSTARYEGVVDNARDQIDLEVQRAAQAVDMYTDKSRNTIRNATIKATGGLEDYGVYIINGNIATHDDGSIDISNSDDMILYYDPTTNTVEHADAMMFAELGSEENADEVRSQAMADAKEKAIKETTGIIDGVVEVGTQFKTVDADGTEHTYEVLADNGDGTAMITIDGNIPTELVKGENVQVPVSFEELQKMKDASDQQRLQAAKAQREQMEKERAEQQMQLQTKQAENPAQEDNIQSAPIEDNIDYSDIIREDGKVQMVDVSDKDGNNLFPDAKDVFYIQGNKMRTKFAYIDANGELKTQSFPTGLVKIKTRGEVSVDDYKKYRNTLLSAESSAMPESSMIEDNSGENRGEKEVETPTIEGETATPAEETAAPESAETPATEQTPAMTLEDGTEVPMLEDGNPDFSKLTAAQTAELYDSQFGEDADSIVSGYVSDAKKALDKANNMTVKGKTFLEQKASKDAKEKAIADAQAAYDSAIAIRDAYNERQLAKVEDTAEGRKNLIEKARRKFARLKSAVKDDAEAVAQIYKETVGTLLHRLYDGTGIDVTDTIPLTAEEYVASNLGAHSLNYEGTETSKGVKQETGLSREDFAKTQLLAADGKGTTIDALVHSLWENRPSNLDSLNTQDIRNALIGVLTSGFKASEARSYVENIRIAQAEKLIEEERTTAENAAYYEQQKAKEEEEKKKAELEKKAEEEKKKAEEEKTEDNEQTKFPDKLKEGSETIEVPEDATDENPLGLQLSKDKVPFKIEGGKSGETYDINDKEDRKRLVAENSVDDKDILDIDMPKHVHKAIKELCKKMGLKVQFLYMGARSNGWIENGTMYLALDTEKATQFVFGHEMTHAIKQKNPEAYKELVKVAMAVTTKKKFEEDLAKVYQNYHGISGYNNVDDYVEEVVADNLGKFINDFDLAQKFSLRLNHPILGTILHAIQKIKSLLYGDFYKSVDALERIVEKAYVETAKGQVTNSETGEDVSFSLRQKPEPKKKGIGYKVFVLKDGKLYPPMVANPNGAATPVGVWLDADAAPIAGESKTGRPQVKQGGKGTQGGSGKLAYRPGWHLGVVPYAIQFNRKDAEGNKTLFPKNFVFAEVEYAADVDYQEEARQEGINPSGKYQHSLAGLKHLPTDGFYMYRTNPNPETDPWVITGAMKVNRILTRAEQAELVKNAGREPQQIQEGDIVTDDVVNSINQEIADAPKFSIKTYHGSQASFDKFDHSFMGSGEGAQAYGWGTYVSEVEGIAKAYAKANAKKNAPSRLMYQGKPMTYKTPSIIYQVALDMDKFNISAKEAISKMIDADEKKLASVGDTPFAKMKAKQVQDELNVLKGLNPSDFKINEDYDTVAQDLVDTKSGLDLLEDELKDAKSYVDLYQSRLDEAKEELSKAKESGTGLGVDMYESDVMYYSEQVEKYKQNVKTKESDIKDVKTKIDALQKKLDSMEKPRNLYSVDIPDDTGDNYIGWDEPLNAKQIGMWKKALLSVVPESDRAYYEEWADGMLENRKKENNPLTGKDAYYAIDSKYASKKTSMALSKAGFVGVKVIAQRNAGGNKDGKMNYVIFDENNAQITNHTKFSLRLKSAIDETETNPSDAQKESGNYKKGHIKFGGYDYTIENPKGSTRSGKDANGKEWKVTMHDTYGYIRGKFGKDGDHLDMFINDKADLDNWDGDVFVVDQVNPDGSFDEHKVMYGYDSMDDAKKAYLANYSDGWQVLGNITGASKDEFDKWLDTSNRKLKPFADYANVKFSLKDNQGNPLNQDGTLKLDKIKSVDELTDEDFLHPTRNVELPSLPNKIADAIGTEGKPVVIKKNIFERNYMRHKDVTPELSKVIFKSALYNPDLYGQNQKKTRPYNWVLINTKDEKGNNRTVLLEVNPNKDNVEIVHWHFVNDKNLGLIKKQAIREGDQVLILPSEQSEEVGGLSNLTDDLSAAKIDNSSETAKENGEKFSLKDEKTMFGMHNISLDKLRKAIKQGGFAAPSMGVIDSKNGIYSGYGEITLIPKAEKIAKRTGKNIGTYAADAWTPIYPPVEKKFGGNGGDVAYDDIESVPKEMQRLTRNAINSFMDGREANELAYLYLQEKGKAPELVHVEGKYPKELHDEVKGILGKLNGIYNTTDEQKEKLLDLFIREVYDGNKEEFDNDIKKFIKKDEEFIKKRPNSNIAKDKQLDVDWMKEHGYDYGALSRFVDGILRDAETSGKVDENATMKAAQQYIQDKGMKEDFDSWKEKLNDRYNVEEVIFAGYKPDGNRKYLPNTVENAVKVMKQDGKNASVGSASFSHFVASILKPMGTLDQIRKKKGNLTGNYEDVEKFQEKWQPVYDELADNMQPDAEPFESYGMDRLEEVATQKNPKKYAKEEYGVDLTDEDINKLNELIEAVKNDKPSIYFETKFMRPYGLDEFEKAIVPNDTPSDVVDALKMAGIDVSSYERGNAEDRQKVTMDAINSSDNIRFSLAGERGAAASDKAEERTIRIDNLSVAKDMEKNKKKAKAIKVATGWERGADGKWRYEMPDVVLRDPKEWVNKKTLTLSDIVEKPNDLFKEYPELFDAYPKLKDVKIQKGRAKMGGSYYDNTITLNLGYIREAIKSGWDIYYKIATRLLKRTLVHEVQHYIQHEEGFAKGGSEQFVRDAIKDEFEKVTKQIRGLRAEGKEDEANALVERNKALYNAYVNEKDSYKNYKSLSGEVEARNVSARLNMTPEERRKTLAESTEDVARKDQIFLGVGDVSFSLRDMADGKESGAADMAEDLKSLNTPDEVDDAIKTAIDDMPSGWKMANKKMIHIAQALGENRKAEIAGEEPKFSLKNLDGTLIKAGTYFSGGGLVEEGLKGIIDPVVAVEYDEKISGVYRNNFGQHIVTADVRDVDPKELVKQIDGEVEYFHASPVCKNYSQAKSNHTEVELDKETAASTAEFINAIKPKVVTIENVKGYKDSDAMKTITDALDANGYTWDADVYNAADYGGYTNRERLIVRAVRDGKLPAKPKKMAHKSGWYEAVADIIPTLTEKKNGVAPWMDIRLKADGIDWRNIDKPLYVMGSAYADGKIPHAFADELLPTLRTKSGDVIVMPDGKVYRAMGRVLARVSGVSDDYKMPFSENLSHTIIGNGIPTQLTEHVIAPLLTGSDPKFSIRTYHGTGAKFDKFDLSHALEGEGSETFGHGVYVTNSKEIGTDYAQRAKDKKAIFGFEFVNPQSMSKEAQDMLRHYMYKHQDVAKGLENARKDLKDVIGKFPDTDYLQELNEILAKDDDSIAIPSNRAYRYDVDIPDDNGSNYLGWNESQNFPLEKWYRLWEITHHGFNENEYFKDGGARYDIDRIERITQMKLESPENGMQKLPTLKGEELYHALEDFFDRERPSHGAELASRALSEIGFVGIKYPAGMIHGGAVEGDYNYVIFDEDNANIVGNTKFSLRGSTPYDKQMEEWMEKNHLEKGAVPMEKPIMKEGENIFDYANRMVEWTRNQNLWKTAPKQTGFQDALEKWKADNGLSPDAYPPVRPHRENYSTEIGYAEDLEEYNKKKDLWKSAPKPKDFDLSVDLEDMNKQLRNIRRAVLNQKNYDQRTVKAVSDLVRKMLNIGWGDGLSRGKVGNLLSAAKNATGANDVKKYLDKVMGILAENYLNRLSTAYDNLINTKGARADQSGVIKMGSLDANGQAFMSEYKKAINMDDKSLNNYIANIEEDSAKNEDNVEMNDYRLAGIQAAIIYKQQIGGNDADIAELKRQIGELKNKKDVTKEDKDLLNSLEKKLFENKFDRITMFENLLNNIQRMVKESKGRAKEFREKIAEHKNEILHRANLDLEGVDSTYYDTTTAKKKFVNNDLQRAVFSSTYTFEQFLKFFGKHSANGEGRLYNYFHKLNQDALDEEQLYNEMNRNALDEKTKELFGKNKFMNLVGIDGKGMKEMDVEVTDYSNKETGKRTIHLKQGQMLYIYLVNKETDGEMKLRAMGITEEDVAAIEENLDPRVKAMGEWLQDEYLPECQRRYQATHTKYFGAPMKEVENYFPLAINNRARNVKEDVNQDSDAMSQLASTSTGAIVTRRVNVIPLDIENADAFEVAFNHLQEMEEWSAMLPFRQDINTLLSYTHFRNQVQNMSSVAYGSGKTLWDEFKQTAQIAAGTYKPKVNAGMMDSRIAATMGGIAVAKISGRLWTAIKQSQSATVFLPECDFTRFVKNGVNPYGSWKWAMENIPDFRKRVENMTYGDVKLRQYLDELEKWHDWTKTISKIGMAPNILVDGITCAVGARSVYETEVNRLTKLGYPKEKAEEKAYYKAVAAYNKTQQSSGGMYLSPMQVDRTYVSAALSLFKNANFAYGRMQIEACRGLARTYDFWGGKHKTTLIESMTRQIMEEDGLDENTARAIAKATYNRTFRQSIGRLINFATLVPVSWALYKVLPYLLTGDDDDKKKDMIEEAVLKGFATSLSDNYVIPFVSNILNAGLKVEDGKPTFDPEVFRYQNLYINPATSDLANIYSMVGNQKWYSVANKLGMLGVQSLIGFNPETVGALYQALSEADYDNGNTAKEWQIGILKAISAPEESIRELYMDELGLKGGNIKKIPLAELEKRYAERQINRDNLLSQIGMDAETFNGYVDKYQKSFEKKIKDKMDKWDEYDKKKADEFFDTTSDPKLRDMIEKKRTKDANAAADEQIAKEGLNQEKKGKEPSEEAYDAVKMSIDVAEDNAISTYNKVLNKRYAALNDEYNNQTDAMKYIFMSNHPNFKAYKDIKSEYTNYGKKIKELKEKLVSADGYDAKQTILKQIRAEREKFSELQSKVR
jgi:site-specific DNA-cytosine methylase